VVVRAALLTHRYRSGFEWDHGDLDRAARLVQRLRSAVERRTGADPRPFAARLRAALDDDLDAPSALVALDELAGSVLAGGTDANAGPAVDSLARLLGLAL